MKIELNDGQIYACPETVEEVQALLKMVAPKKAEKQPAKREPYGKKCPDCGERFKNLGIHQLRAHMGRGWSTRKKEPNVLSGTIPPVSLENVTSGTTN